MSGGRPRAEVVTALVEAHGCEVPWARIALVLLQTSPPVTESEKAQARSIVLAQRAGSWGNSGATPDEWAGQDADG